MEAPSPPPAPNPEQTAAAQAKYNQQTAVSQYGLNATNQVTPQGSLTYRQIGNWEDGTPRFEATQSYSPGEQGIFETNQRARQNVGNIAEQQSARIAELLGKPFSFQGLPENVTSVNVGGIQPAGQITSSINGAGPIQSSLSSGSPITMRVSDTGMPIQSQIAGAGNIQTSYGPTDYSSDRTKVEDAIYSRLNPQLDRDTAALQTQLINKGITPGSEQWNNAVDADNRSRTDARMQAVLAGGQEQSRLAGLAQQAGQFANNAQAQQFGQNQAQQQAANAAQLQAYQQALANAQFANTAQQQEFSQGQAMGEFANNAQAQQYAQNANNASFANQAQQQQYAQNANNQQVAFNQALTNANLTNSQRQAMIQEQATLRNQPINEISALMSGSQVSAPNYTSTPTPGIAPVDYLGAVQQNLNQQNLGYNAQINSNNAFMSGLFGLGSAALGGWMRSDIASKEDIEVVGERADGLHVIDFDYKPEEGLGNGRHRGLVAQEVAQVYPRAVARDRSGKLAVNYDAVPSGSMMALGEYARRFA